jgi:hypothetical protein
MDQLKEFLGVVKRQHFWFIAPILLIVGVVGWIMATKKLSAEFDANSAAVQGYLSQMQQVTSRQPHPNDDYHTGMEQLIEQRRENVRSAWATKWERQKQQLRWPEQLNPQFLQKVENLRPIESVDLTKPENDIPSYLRRDYNRFIKLVLPQLAQKIGAKWEPQRTGMVGGGFRERAGESRGEGGEGRAVVVEENYLVEWDSTNQGTLETRFDWGDSAPTTAEVLYAQEDLWVLTTVIEIIARTNGDAMTRSQAPIKKIDLIAIGKDVEPPASPDTTGYHVIRPAPLKTDEGDGGDADAAADSSAEPESSGPARPEGSSGDFTGDFNAAAAPKNTVIDLVKNRYYDENYQPIADYDTLMSNVTVAKRIPVRLRVEMDQRKINELLVQCANAPLTFEVRQIQINPQITKQGQFGGGGEGMRFEGGTMMGGGGRTRELEDYQSLSRVVELFGIIYIFNPVAEDVLGGERGGGSDAPVADEESTAGMPADRRLATR